ncbi:fructose-6-phosphate aldolase [Desulfolutivibrio sulfoxidireducens]|uniref:fructose-6-phosphate aldolase n=1 Tax=Desulfolutivibrio sulfoxidireducens TaxID=2773299 RepID=UPI00159D7721|nr:fructose-6-phosphate aldolase [Desulfolutivibrio sulfoxidireducens]QLA16219.1 fructose-6-phosphate aldolase [Desulfolutivibrio sulfoxidireducens]QLA19883.1 fructose-6-phosphate aldolase [Desulfolutivibrio sulfoxidireducens]
MKFFLDTANLDEIRQAKDYGLIDGVTTNPSLFARESEDWRTLAEKICRETPGPVSLEVIGQSAGEMIAEANELVKIGPNVVVKIPMTLEGLKAVNELTAQAIDTNVTLVFHPLQALLAAKAGATFVSPFVGRLDALAQDGMEVVGQIVAIFKNYDFRTQVLVASVRHPMHVLEAALLGAEVATIPFAVVKELSRHPLTDKGLEIFMKDWEKVKK